MAAQSALSRVDRRAAGGVGCAGGGQAQPLLVSDAPHSTGCVTGVTDTDRFVTGVISIDECVTNTNGCITGIDRCMERVDVAEGVACGGPGEGGGVLEIRRPQAKGTAELRMGREVGRCVSGVVPGLRGCGRWGER